MRIGWLALLSVAVAAHAWGADAGTCDADSRAILPGWGRYFWNANAKWYIHPPAFDFDAVADAADYRFSLTVDGKTGPTFAAKTPKADLGPVWKSLPRKGFVEVRCEAMAADGKALKTVGEAKFWKNAPFDPSAYPPSARPYGEAAQKTYDYVFGLPAQKKLAETGLPDFSYSYNCYPSKMVGAVVAASANAAKLHPDKKDEMLKLARAGADYLIATSEPANAPLAYFTQTYAKDNDKYTAKEYQGQHMLLYPAMAAKTFVALYRVGGERKYLAAAENIARTYLKLQGEDGTWCLKMWAKDGKPVNPNRLFPMTVCDLLEELYAETQKPAYRAAADRAFAFIEKGPLADWNWEGQFEDVAPSAPYRNLTKHPAVDTAMYLLRRYPGDKSRFAQARALMRFAEDQFVAWERPCREDGFSYPSKYPPKDWPIFPTVMEQYEWYVPTDASVAKMIRGYLAIYAAGGCPADLAKARALGDALTRAQQASGRIPTQWMSGSYMTNTDLDWVNCMIASANALAQIAAMSR